MGRWTLHVDIMWPGKTYHEMNVARCILRISISYFLKCGTRWHAFQTSWLTGRKNTQVLPSRRSHCSEPNRKESVFKWDSWSCPLSTFEKPVRTSDFSDQNRKTKLVLKSRLLKPLRLPFWKAIVDRLFWPAERTKKKSVSKVDSRIRLLTNFWRATVRI